MWLKYLSALKHASPYLRPFAKLTSYYNAVFCISFYQRGWVVHKIGLFKDTDDASEIPSEEQQPSTDDSSSSAFTSALTSESEATAPSRPSRLDTPVMDETINEINNSGTTTNDCPDSFSAFDYFNFLDTDEVELS